MTSRLYRIAGMLALTAVSLMPASSPAAGSAPVQVIRTGHAPVQEQLPLSGTITSEQSAALSSRVSGLINKIHVDAGHTVMQGDALIELDPTLARLALKRAEAALNESRAALSESRRLHNEAVNLGKSNSIPETTILARKADVDMKQATVATLEAEYRQQAEVVTRHTLYAPFAGAVSRKLTEVGEWVETGTPVIELVAVSQLRLDVQAPQDYFNRITKETDVNVRLDAIPEREFNGRVIATVPVNNTNARTFLVRVHIEDAGDYIIPGMSAEAVFTVDLHQKALTLPRDAIIKHPDGRNTVWVVNEAGGEMTASELQVKLGRTLTESVVVKQGLEPGRLVVVRGNETLQDGQTVHILNPNKAAMN